MSQGLKSWEQRLRAVPSKVKAEVRIALEKSANEIVATAKQLVPVDSGALRDSIGWTWGAAPKGSMTLGKVQTAPNSDRLAITIYAGSSEAFWARWVEHGTVDTPAQPFFFPAYRMHRRRARNRINRAIRKGLKEA